MCLLFDERPAGAFETLFFVNVVRLGETCARAGPIGSAKSSLTGRITDGEFMRMQVEVP